MGKVGGYENGCNSSSRFYPAGIPRMLIYNC